MPYMIEIQVHVYMLVHAESHILMVNYVQTIVAIPISDAARVALQCLFSSAPSHVGELWPTFADLWHCSRVISRTCINCILTQIPWVTHYLQSTTEGYNTYRKRWTNRKCLQIRWKCKIPIISPRHSMLDQQIKSRSPGLRNRPQKAHNQLWK